MTSAASPIGFFRAHYGWVMVAVGFTLSALAFGGLGMVGVFLVPLSEEFGWSRGATAFGYTSISLASAAAALAWGFVIDRYGSRGPALVAMLAMGAALLALSTTQSLWQFYTYYVIFGGLGFAAIGAPLAANIGFWFEHNKGLAIGLMAAGGAVGQGVIPFIARLIVSQSDWRTAYLVIGLSYFVIGLPLALLVRESPVRLAALAGSMAAKAAEAALPLAPREAMGWIAVAVIFCCICMAVPIVHLVPLLTDQGWQPETAVGAFMVLMLAGGFGRVAGGMLCDRIGAIQGYLIASITQTALVIWFPHLSNLFGVYAVAAVFGFGYSAVMSSILVTARTLVPARLAGRIMGVVTMFGMFGMGIGSYLGGVFFDLTQAYVWSYSMAGLSGLVNMAILSFFLSRFRRANQLPGTA